MQLYLFTIRVIKKVNLFWLLVLLTNLLNSQSIDNNCIKISKSIFEQKTTNLKKIDSFHDLSILEFKKSNYENAIFYAFKEVDLYEILNTKGKDYKNAIYNIAYFYYVKNDFNNAIKYFTKYLNFKKSRKDVFAYRYLGIINNKTGNYSKAILYLKKAVFIHEKQNDLLALPFVYSEIIDTYTNYSITSSLKQRFKYLNKWNKLSTKIEFNNQEYYNLNNNFAFYYLNKSNFTKVKWYYTKNLNQSLKNKDSLISSAMYINLGELYNREKKIPH